VAKDMLRNSDCGFALEATDNPAAEWVRANVATRLIGPLTRLPAVRSTRSKPEVRAGLNRGELTDEQWARLAPLLPPQRPHTGRPARDHRTVVSAILWVLRTGAPWRDLPERFGPWGTAYSRFRRWAASGVWQRVLDSLQRDAEVRGELDQTTHYVDGTIVRAHQSAAGARGGQEKEALGRSRGGFGTKVHLRAEGGGRPLVFVLSGGERHEAAFFEPLMETREVDRDASGWVRRKPALVVGDKGYSYDRVRAYLNRHNIEALIPLRSDQGDTASFDRAAYRGRNRIERLVGRLKRWRRVATRYDKRASIYLAVLTVAAIMLWL
jgi:transposase